jgi:hypothetical protein
MNSPQHIWYVIISTAIIVGLLLLFHFAPWFQKQRNRNLTLFFISLVCFLVHISEYWLAVPLGVLEFIDTDMGGLLILSPCAASMVGFLIVGFMAVSGRGGAAGKWLAVGVAYIGFVGAFSTVYLSPRYAAVDFFSGWYLASNLFAHSILLLGCVYLVTGGFIKVKFSNTLPTLLVGAIYYALGCVEILIFMALQMDYKYINPMYFFEPFGNIYPFFGIVLFAVAMGVTVAFTLFFEFCFVKKQSRFYKNWNKDYWLYQ